MDAQKKRLKKKKKLNHKGRMFNRSGIKVTLVLLSKARVFFNPIFCKTNMFNIKITIMQVSLKSCLYFFNCKSVALNWQTCQYIYTFLLFGTMWLISAPVLKLCDTKNQTKERKKKKKSLSIGIVYIFGFLIIF